MKKQFIGFVVAVFVFAVGAFAYASLPSRLEKLEVEYAKISNIEYEHLQELKRIQIRKNTLFCMLGNEKIIEGEDFKSMESVNKYRMNCPAMRPTYDGSKQGASQ